MENNIFNKLGLTCSKTVLIDFITKFDDYNNCVVVAKRAAFAYVFIS